MLTRRKLLKAALCAPAVAMAPGVMREAYAQAFPARSLRMVVPFPPGGTTDIIARLVAQRMSEAMGQAVVVENRAGSGRGVGAATAKLAAEYGYPIG